MELQFQQIPFEYLRCVLQKCGTQEESTELIVPDRLPDVERILSTNACVCVREKECRQGAATVSGGIKTAILYADESSDTPYKLESYLPFSVRIDHSDITEESEVSVSASVASVDAKILNSRKVHLRVLVSYCVAIYDAATDICYSCDGQPDNLQVKNEEYRLLLPRAYAERNFTVTDGLLLPQSEDRTNDVIFVRAEAEISEKRLAGDKAVFKGTVNCEASYLAEDGRFCTQTLQIPFSQFCEMQETFDDSAVLTLTAAISDCSWELVTNPNSLEISVNLTVQCMISVPLAVTVTDDAYCLHHDFTPNFRQYAFDTRLDLQTQTDPVRAFAEADVREVLDAHVFLGTPTVKRDNGTASVCVPSKSEVLYRDGENRLQCVKTEYESAFTCSLCDGAQVIPEAALCSGVSAVPTGNGIEVRYTVCLTCDTTAQWTQSTIIGGEISERASKDACPQLIAKRVEGKQPLWDIAKAYDTTVKRICNVNGIESDWFADGVLLIPTERK